MCFSLADIWGGFFIVPVILLFISFAAALGVDLTISRTSAARATVFAPGSAARIETNQSNILL